MHHIVDFCILQICSNETIQNLSSKTWNFLDKYGSKTTTFVLIFSLNLVIERKKGPITRFGLNSFFSSKFSFGSHFVNAKGNDAYDANDMIKH